MITPLALRELRVSNVRSQTACSDETETTENREIRVSTEAVHLITHNTESAQEALHISIANLSLSCSHVLP
jgi:hypothetical protein